MDELKKLLESLQKTFADFKAENDKRLSEIEAKGMADPLLSEKVDKINAEVSRLDEVRKRLDTIEAAVNRSAYSPGSQEDPVKAEHRKVWNKFMRTGRDGDGLQDLERQVYASLKTFIGEDGGLAIPEELDRNILTLLRDASPMRQVCTVVTVGGADYKMLVDVAGVSSGWVGETAARPETDTPQLKEISPYMGEVYANPASTQRMLDDAFFDVEGWLTRSVQTEFAEQEGDAFTNGDGVLKAKGFLSYPTAITTDATRAFGTLQRIHSGVAAALGSPDKFIDMIYALKSGHRSGAVWQMAGLTVAEIRKLKDGDGNYLWRPGLEAGQPSSLLAYEVVENEDMPAIGAGNHAIAFGNFKRGYFIVDRIGIRVLRDNLTNKPYVHFYTTKRVGGFLVDSNAIKLMRIAA